MAWVAKLKSHRRHHVMFDVMKVVLEASAEIIQTHRGGQTEAFYEKMLSSHLYDKHIPFMTQVQI